MLFLVYLNVISIAMFFWKWSYFVKKIFVSVFLTLSFLSAFANADPEDDARRIVELTVTDDVFILSFEAIGEMMAGNFQNEFSKAGLSMTDGAAAVLSTMVCREMALEMADIMREPMVDAYLANHSAEALAAYRAFLDTPEGMEIVKNMPAMMKESNLAAEQFAERLATDAVGKVYADMQNDVWPDGTPKTVQNELKSLFAK